MNLVEFLLARIAEDEAVAREALREWDDGEWRGPSVYDDGVRDVAVALDPRRVLAECGAKRRIIESVDVLTGGEKSYAERMRHTDVEDARYQIVRDMLGWLALPYADHPDYDETWRP